MVELHRLLGFYWVAQAGGYARAARVFPYPITQPALHQQVRKLESELDLALLERVGRDKMIPTPAGRHLHEFIAPFFRDLPTVLQAIREGDYDGVLKVQAEPLLIRHLMPSWLRRLQRKHPGIRIDLGELAEPNTEPLRRGDADLLLAYLPEVSDDIATMDVAMMRPFLVLPKDHPRATRKRIAVSDLTGDTFISYRTGTLPHDLQMRALQDERVTPQHTIAVDSTETILGFVESGLGFSLVPSLEKDGPKGRGLTSRPFQLKNMSFPVVLAWRKDTPENPLLDAFLECAT